MIYKKYLIKSKLKTFVFFVFLFFSQNLYSDQINSLRGYFHIEQAETKYTNGQGDNRNPRQPFTRA